MKKVISLLFVGLLTVSAFAISSDGFFWQMPFGSTPEEVAVSLNGFGPDDVIVDTVNSSLMSMLVGKLYQEGADIGFDFYENKLVTKSFRYLLTQSTEEDMRLYLEGTLTVMSELLGAPQYYYETEYNGDDFSYIKMDVAGGEEIPETEGDIDLVWSLTYGHIYSYNSGIVYTFTTEENVGFCGYFLDDENVYMLCTISDGAAINPALDSYIAYIETLSQTGMNQ